MFVVHMTSKFPSDSFTEVMFGVLGLPVEGERFFFQKARGQFLNLHPVILGVDQFISQ